MTFPLASPHGPITKVADGLHVVRGSFKMGPGTRIGRTMTIIEHGGELTVLNSIRLAPAEDEALTRLGPVRHVVKLSDAHGIDEPYYVERYKPTFWALDGARLPAGITATGLGSAVPIEGAIVVDLPGIGGGLECALWIPAGNGTLITCDALQNHEGKEPHASALARAITPLLGFKGGVLVASMWRRIRKVTSGEAISRAFEPLLTHRFENLVTGHGPAVIGGADKLARAAIERAVKA